jgi:hypothetical protein
MLPSNENDALRTNEKPDIEKWKTAQWQKEKKKKL